MLRCRLEQQPIAADKDRRPATQTRPFSSVSALAAAADGPVVGSAALRVDPGNSRAACIRTRAAAMPLRLRHLLEISCHRHRTWQVQHRMACATKAVSSRECGNQKPMHVTSSSLHLLYARGARNRCHGSRPLVLRCRRAVAARSSGQAPTPPTPQTRPFASVSALAAAAGVAVVGSAAV